MVTKNEKPCEKLYVEHGFVYCISETWSIEKTDNNTFVMCVWEDYLRQHGKRIRNVDVMESVKEETTTLNNLIESKKLVDRLHQRSNSYLLNLIK